MSDELQGKEFGGALEELRRAARINLPRLSDEYHSLTTSVESTADYGSEVYKRHQRLSHYGNSGPFYGQFSALRDFLHSALGETTNNYLEIASLLDSAIEDFCAQDDAAANELERLRDKIEDSGTGSEKGDGYDFNDESTDKHDKFEELPDSEPDPSQGTSEPGRTGL